MKCSATQLSWDTYCGGTFRSVILRTWEKFLDGPCTACGHRIAHKKWKETKLQPGTAGPGNRLGSCLVSFHFLWAILCPQAVHWRIVILSKSTSRCEQSRKVQKGEICQLVPRPATYLALVGFENSSSRQHFLQVVTEQTQPYPRHAMCNFITAHKSQPLAITKYRGGKFAQK